MHGPCKGLHGEHSMTWLQLVEHMAIVGGLKLQKSTRLPFCLQQAPAPRWCCQGFFGCLAHAGSPLTCQCRETRGEAGLQHLPAGAAF